MALAFRLSPLVRLVTNGPLLSSRTTRRLISLTSLYRGKIVPYKLADIGEGIREVVIKEWFVKDGDKVRQFDNICEVQSDKASVTITSRYDGTVKTVHYKLNETCLVGSALVDIELDSEEPDDPAPPAAPTQQPIEVTLAAKNDDEKEASPQEPTDKTLTTPAVRKIAKEHNVNLAQVPATGKDGRVLKEDILAYLADKAPAEVVRTDASGTTDLKRLVEKKYAKHMWKSMTQSLAIPHFVYSDDCDVTKLVKLRAEVKEAFQRQGLALSYMPFFLKAISRALLQYPELNALVNEEAESVDIKKEHNISLAMDTPGGLVVPNIKNVQNMCIVDIAKELNRLQALGKKASIPPKDLMGGTISISNIGIVGGTYTKPVILSPQVVIGAVGKIQRLPKFDELGNIVARDILSISWAADHRVVDGVTMAKFSNLWKHYLENPYHLTLGL
ncbi:lipoamide acyltransferase component of branched-chain alpha-keto acid dehydrogenase complex, mitochondrial [Copidosoma floridanum]|uniref:lipoamide acyltransferase component of branched-chain alpha-keto acid dehydrogenase complex, mitochondrial n=1 Tax=Copidosoma floridanum TaxID=29053 RepID=UPI0006C9A373|nr:lipoamide acyltransferase component of branched-chain alpha-keto acid dehydrogenase complex, mitochondrial [Copidosoma floridanum]